MFKQRKLATGVVIGVLGIIGIIASVRAVQVNPDGTGQVLIFPYFNANSGYVTNINLVNSTDKTKAIKVRFREGKNSYDVLDFNIYMPPEDVWTGSIRLGDDGNGQQVGTFNTLDRTCTIPIDRAADCTKDACEVVQPFLGHQMYPSHVSAADTREGYVEVIEMGVVTDPDLQAAAMHKKGEPVDCGALAKAWTNRKFTSGRGSEALGLGAPTGGLFGSSAVLNVEKGVGLSIDPVAIDNYSTEAQHYRPAVAQEALLPSLASGNVTQSTVMVKKPDGTTDIVVTEWNKQTDTCLKSMEGMPCGDNPYPIAHVLAAPYLMNEYFLDPSFGYAGRTDWVVSFPMKKHGIHAEAENVTASFSNGIFDRERDKAGALGTVQDASFGFLPTEGSKGSISMDSVLNREVNVISFVSEDPSYDKSTTVLASPSAMTLSVGPFVHGWARLSFSGYSLSSGFKAAKAYGANPAEYDASSPIYQGVPVLGFAAIDGNISNNPAARFGDVLPHKMRRY